MGVSEFGGHWTFDSVVDGGESCFITERNTLDSVDNPLLCKEFM